MFTVVQAASGESRSQLTSLGIVGVEAENLGPRPFADAIVEDPAGSAFLPAFPFRVAAPAKVVGSPACEPLGAIGVLARLVDETELPEGLDEEGEAVVLLVPGETVPA
jgi:hypothetical protein